MWWMIVLASVVLIGTGLVLLVRDFTAARGPGNEQDQPPASPQISPAGGIVAAAAVTSGPKASQWAGAAAGEGNAHVTHDGGMARLKEILDGIADDAADRGPSFPRSTTVEVKWQQLSPDIAQAIATLNQILAASKLSFGPSGEATWSLQNHGFGDYRRALVGEESLGWLRMETTPDMRVVMKLRAHEGQYATINRSIAIAMPADAAALADALADCSAAAAGYAMWRAAQSQKVPRGPRMPAAEEISVSESEAPAPSRGLFTGAETRGAAARIPAIAATAARSTPAPIPALIAEAIELVNGAFKDVGARLTAAAAPQRREPIGATDRALSVEIGGSPVGLMLIEPRPDRIDISVGVVDPSNFSAARRQTVAIEVATVHTLAEAIATCAWPAIATEQARASAA